ncbi:MAG: hypothetical protein HKP30_14400 [Myxococcales bacterium]|nr:hypothetical protein [Myxococcales bacterium]
MRASRLPWILLLLACGAPESATPGPDDGTAILHQHRDERFTLTVSAKDENAARWLLAGVVPRGAYHLAADYPARLELDAPDRTDGRRRVDPTEDTARSEQRLDFRTKIGLESRQFSGRLRFGVCRSDEVCEPVDHPFEFILP